MSYEITATGDEALAARTAATSPEDNGTKPEEGQLQEQVQDQQKQEEVEVANTEDKQEEVVDEAAEPEYFFGGESVTIEVPEDIQSALSEKGIDADALVGELFAKEGNFSLSEGTRAKLDEAFGKGLVDAYLNLYKGQNELSLKGFQAEAEQQKATMVANTTSFNELVGGDDGWNQMSGWAAENLSDSELASFNAVMQLDAKHWDAQRMVVEALKGRHAAAQKESTSDHIRLVTDEGAPAAKSIEGLPGELTRQQFQMEMRNPRYQKDPEYAAAIDNIRRASAAKGV